MPDRPNVVLICVDQWRGDCLSVAGHPVVHTPYPDQMALDGARFNRAYTATPSCIPARAGLYTGLSQRSHGRIGYQDGMTFGYATDTFRCGRLQSSWQAAAPCRSRTSWRYAAWSCGSSI